MIGTMHGLCRYVAARTEGPILLSFAHSLYSLFIQLAPIAAQQCQQQQQQPGQQQGQGQLAQPVQADASMTIVNCFIGLKYVDISLWRAAQQDFIATATLIQQGIQEVAAQPGVPSAWPMLLWRLVWLANACVSSGVSPALTLTNAPATTTALLRGASQLLYATPALATEEGVAVRGAASEAEAAWAASSALFCILRPFATASTGNEVRMAAEAAVTLVHRCYALVTSPAAAGALQQRLHWLDTPWSYPLSLGRAGPAHSLLVFSLQVSAEVVGQYVSVRLDGCASHAVIDALPRVQRQVLALAMAMSLPECLRTQAAGSAAPLQRGGLIFYEVAKLLVRILDLVQGAQGDADGGWAEKPAAASVVQTATALMSFAEHDGRSGKRSAEVDVSMPGCMQLAAAAASCLASLAHRLRSDDSAAASIHEVLKGPGARPPLAAAARQLLQLLAWVSEPTTPVATSSAVLAKALPALATLAASDETARLRLAEGGSGKEWAPVAAALRRRLPRRMAARFLPDVDAVTAAVETGREGGSEQESPAALAAMATLNLQTASIVCADHSEV